MKTTLTDERLMDLVRYARHQLSDEGLLTDDEYARLVQHQGAVARLESYDAAIATKCEANAKVAREALLEAAIPLEVLAAQRPPSLGPKLLEQIDVAVALVRKALGVELTPSKR